MYPPKEHMDFLLCTHAQAGLLSISALYGPLSTIIIIIFYKFVGKETGLRGYPIFPHPASVHHLDFYNHFVFSMQTFSLSLQSSIEVCNL